MITVVLSVLGIAALVGISFMLTYFDEVRSKKWSDRIDHIRKAGSRMNRKLKNPVHHTSTVFPPAKLSR